MSAPTIDPSRWDPGIKFSLSFGGKSPECLALWCLTNLADVLLAGWARHEPEMVTITIPKDVAEAMAQGFSYYVDPRPVVVRACREALEAR